MFQLVNGNKNQRVGVYWPVLLTSMAYSAPCFHSICRSLAVCWPGRVPYLLSPFFTSSKRLISASVFVTHEAHCRRHLALCEVCDEPVPVQEMERHHQENHALTPCDRCGARLPRDQLEEHVVCHTLLHT